MPNEKHQKLIYERVLISGGVSTSDFQLRY